MHVCVLVSLSWHSLSQMLWVAGLDTSKGAAAAAQQPQYC